MAVYLIEQNMYRDVSYPIYKILEIVVDIPLVDLEELSRSISIPGKAEVTVLEGNSLYIPVRDSASEDKVLGKVLLNLSRQNISCRAKEVYSSLDEKKVVVVPSSKEGKFKKGDTVHIDSRIYSTEEFDSNHSGTTNGDFEVIEVHYSEGHPYYVVKALKNSFFATKDEIYYSFETGMSKKN